MLRASKDSNTISISILLNEIFGKCITYTRPSQCIGINFEVNLSLQSAFYCSENVKYFPWDTELV